MPTAGKQPGAIAAPAPGVNPKQSRAVTFPLRGRKGCRKTLALPPNSLWRPRQPYAPSQPKSPFSTHWKGALSWIDRRESTTISGCRKSGLRHFFEVFIAPLRLRRGQGAMQGNPCYARLFADLTRMSPNPIKASGGCGPRTPGGFSTDWILKGFIIRARLQPGNKRPALPASLSFRLSPTIIPFPRSCRICD